MADGQQIEGVDYAWSRPDIAQLAAAGKVFACRYGGPGSTGKQLDPAEARALSAAGVAIVANAEGSAGGLAGGWSAGVDWASRAEARFAACGMPPGRPIYLSVDFDVQSGQWSAVREALQGAASVLGGVHRVGVYGGRRAIEWARRDGVARWFWQTYAWSGGVWVSGNHIEQYRNHVELAGATLDLDRALTVDFGQWMTGEDDMDQGEALVKPTGANRSIGDHYADVQNLRNAFIGDGPAVLGLDGNPIPGYPKAGSPLDNMARLPELLAEHAGTPVDVGEVAAAIATALEPKLAGIAEAAAERAVRKVMLDAATPDEVSGS